MTDLPQTTWPLDQLDEALLALARAAGLRPARAELPAPPPDLLRPPDPHALERWLHGAAARLGLEAEAVDIEYAAVDDLLRGAAPALLWLRGDPERLILVVARRRARLLVLAPDLRRISVSIDDVRAALTAPLEARARPPIDALLDRAAIPSARRPAALRALLRQRLAGAHLAPCWILRPAPGAPLRALLREAALPARALLLLLAHALELALVIAAWSLIGALTFRGQHVGGWWLAWVLLLLTLVPLRMLGVALQGEIARSFGAILKRRLLVGATALATDHTRREGAGLLLARVLETGAIESLALRGGLAALVALVEVAVAAPVLAQGPAPALHLPLLLLFVLLALLLARRQARRLTTWQERRGDLTHHLVEAMVGHRTRLAQETPESWHRADDRRLVDLLAAQRRLDRVDALTALLPRAWLALGVVALLPAFVAGAAPELLAVGIGGVLLAGGAFAGLATGAGALVGALVAHRRAAPILAAAADADRTPPGALLPAPALAPGDDLVLARGLTFRYPHAHAPVLAGVDLTLRAGDRLLLQGPSGGGKSTLGALLAGLREPTHGLLLLAGLDRPTLGLAGWRRRVAAAPQFQENHVLTAPFAFNLLMGRAWPPRPDDLAEAEEICRELGLGDLLDRMPGGLMQMVGETGWQLSHGERSRLFLARALLQRVDLIVLDESFAALDPATLGLALRSVLRRARALVVIAHP